MAAFSVVPAGQIRNEGVFQTLACLANFLCRFEGVKKLPRTQKRRNALVGNQVFAQAVVRDF
jgi:hypothetical protein